MIRALSTSASGLRANQQRLKASAHNTANSTAPDTAKLRTRAQEIPGDGVQTQTRASGSKARGEPVEEAVEQIAAAQNFKANVRAVQTQDDMLGTLLDLRT